MAWSAVAKASLLNLVHVHVFSFLGLPKPSFRGPAARLPTVASQEDLATKASRGQPMFRPRPPAEWEAADGEAEAVSSQGKTVSEMSFGP